LHDALGDVEDETFVEYVEPTVVDAEEVGE